MSPTRLGKGLGPTFVGFLIFWGVFLGALGNRARARQEQRLQQGPALPAKPRGFCAGGLAMAKPSIGGTTSAAGSRGGRAGLRRDQGACCVEQVDGGEVEQ